MATTTTTSLQPSDHHHLVEDEFIDMDLTSSNFLCYTTSCLSPQHPLDFEFQMARNHEEIQPLTSPADELFYNGKLLPLHLPSQLDMVERLLAKPNSIIRHHHHGGSEHFEKTIVITAPNTTTSNTPFESCNVSPSTSCYVSGELNREDYFQQCSVELVESQRKKHSWSKKLRLIKNSGIGSKIKASKAFLKSFFNKSSDSTDEKCSRVLETHTKVAGTAKKKVFGQIYDEKPISVSQINRSTMMKSNVEEKLLEKDCHRRSFSGAIKWQSSAQSSSASTSCSSSFSSDSSKKICGQPVVLKRSSSAGSDSESSIQGAIAYCKKSQQLVSAEKNRKDAELCLLSTSASKVATNRYEEQEKLLSRRK